MEARRGRQREKVASVNFSTKKQRILHQTSEQGRMYKGDQMANHILMTEGSNYKTVAQTLQNDLPRIICSNLQHHRCSV